MGHSMFLSGMVGYLDVENVGARVIACQWEFLVYDLDHVIIFPLIDTFRSVFIVSCIILVLLFSESCAKMIVKYVS